MMMKFIKYLTIAFVAILMGISTTSCDDLGVGSLEKPPGGDVTIDTIFSSANYAERVLWNSYRSLRSGILQNGRSRAIGQDLQSDITDLSHTFKTWGTVLNMYYKGALNSANSGVNDWMAPHCILPYGDNSGAGITTFKAIRNCYIFLDNVHKVPDMSEEYKTRLKAEARVIIAYNMMELFRNYGGIPMIGKVYAPDDDFTNPRMTVEATVDSIVGLIDKAIPDLPWQIPEYEISTWSGRFTQAGAMALKVRLLLFAASPLFNSDAPYLDGEAATDHYTWYGDYQSNRYQRVADAAKELIDKINAQGGYALEMPETEDVAGYRDAYRRAYYFGKNSNDASRSSSEVLVSIRDSYYGPKRWGGSMYDSNLNYGGATCTSEYMRMFPMADGTPITDPSSGWNELVDPLGCEGSGAARKYNRDPRLYETMLCVDDDWGGQIVQTYTKPNGIHYKRPGGSGSTIIRKFIPKWNIGYPRTSEHHFPYIRLPEIYLSYAEALNELGSQSEAFTYINMVRNRVGLKDIEQVGSWDKQSLLKQILTERACEFGFEQVRWFDMTRHKLLSSFDQTLHNVKIEKNGSPYTYSYPEINTNARDWWMSFDKKWFLLPFPVNEVQKGYGLVQNPGW